MSLVGDAAQVGGLFHTVDVGPTTSASLHDGGRAYGKTGLRGIPFVFSKRMSTQ